MNLSRETVAVPATTCPACGKHLDSACMANSNERPAVGDFTVCIECLTTLRFGEGLTVRRPTVAELAALSLEESAAIGDMKRTLKRFHKDEAALFQPDTFLSVQSLNTKGRLS